MFFANAFETNKFSQPVDLRYEERAKVDRKNKSKCPNCNTYVTMPCIKCQSDKFEKLVEENLDYIRNNICDSMVEIEEFLHNSQNNHIRPTDLLRTIVDKRPLDFKRAMMIAFAVNLNLSNRIPRDGSA